MKLNKAIAAAALSIALPAMSFANHAEVVTKWTYQTTDGKRVSQQQKEVRLPDFRTVRLSGPYFTDEKMAKTLLLLNVATELKGSLEAYSKACSQEHSPIMRPLCETPADRIGPGGCFPRPLPRPVPEHECQGSRRQIADRLHSTIKELDGKINKDQFTRSDRKVIEAIDYARKLATNMEKAPEPHYYPRFEGRMRSLSAAAAPSMGAPMAMAKGLNVTSGGAQGYDQFKKIVDAGHVPGSDVLAVDGFLKEFDLSLTDERCDQLLCVTPAVTVDTAAKKMFVQLSMGSNVRPDTFRRKPLNLSVVLDISGSMSANDGTEKSRIEWAKDALNRIVDQMNSDDYLSIVLFDDKVEVLKETGHVTDRAELKAQISRLHTRGGTNLELGMRSGLKQVAAQAGQLEGYEHRVITISDAGTNTGIQDEASFVRLVNTYANDGIGVTVLGVGDDFRGGLVQGFAMTKGGNFQHAQTGLAMLKFFENFDFLVTPIAYNFKAKLAVNGLNAKFSKGYGVPVKDGQLVDELIDIQTLFFSNDGGGAIVLEYNLE